MSSRGSSYDLRSNVARLVSIDLSYLNGTYCGGRRTISDPPAGGLDIPCHEIP